MAASTPAAATRLVIEAACNGTSIGCLRGSSTLCSIEIPPSAGGGGTSSGASMMRGRSSIGSASSSVTVGKINDRGNSMILAEGSAGMLSSSPVTRRSSDNDNAAVPNADRDDFFEAADRQLGSWPSNFNRNEG